MSLSALEWTNLFQTLTDTPPLAFTGRVREISGLALGCRGPHCEVGAVCRVERNSRESLLGEVVGFRQGLVWLMPYGELRGLKPQARVTLTRTQALAPVGPALLGRVIDGLAEPLDGKGPLAADVSYPLYAPPSTPVPGLASPRPWMWVSGLSTAS